MPRNLQLSAWTSHCVWSFSFRSGVNISYLVLQLSTFLHFYSGPLGIHQNHRGLPLLHFHGNVCRGSGRQRQGQNQGQSYEATTLLLQSKLIPILEPPFVADQVVQAVLREREVLLLPWWSFLLIALKVREEYTDTTERDQTNLPQAVMTEPAFMRLSQAFGFNCSMDQFQGRQKRE